MNNRFSTPSVGDFLETADFAFFLIITLVSGGRESNKHVQYDIIFFLFTLYVVYAVYTCTISVCYNTRREMSLERGPYVPPNTRCRESMRLLLYTRIL